MGKIFYIAQIFEGLSILSGLLLGLAICGLIGMVIWKYAWELNTPFTYNQKEEEKRIKDLATCNKWLKRSIIGVILASLVITFVPSKKTYLLMVGGNAVEEVAKNERVQEVAGKTIDLVEQYLDRELNGRK